MTNIKARSRSHCFLGKAISITYSECVSVALVIQHAKRIRSIVLLSVSVRLYHIFLYYLINGAIFCFGFLYKFA